MSEGANDAQAASLHLQSELYCGVVAGPALLESPAQEPSIILVAKSGGYIMYRQDEWGDRVRGWTNERGQVCHFCTPEDIGKGPCLLESSLHLPIIDGKALSPAADHGQTLKYGWVSGGEEQITWKITKPGYYCVLVASSEPQDSPSVPEFHSAHGMLPAELLPLKRLNAWTLVVYGATFVVFAYLAYVNMRSIIILQRHITLVLGSSFLESLVTWVHLVHQNRVGKHSIVLLTASVCASSLRATLSLLFLLLAAIGFGVTFPTLEPRLKRLISILIGAHAVASLLESLAFFFGATIDEKRHFRTEQLLTTPVLFTSSIISTWIMIALPLTTRALKERRQSVKHSMYVLLSRILFVSFLCSFLVILSALRLVASYEDGPAWRSRHWSSLWFYQSGANSLIRLLSTLAIAFVFRPRAQNRASFGLQELSGDTILDFELGEDEGFPPDGHSRTFIAKEQPRTGLKDPFSVNVLRPGRPEGGIPMRTHQDGLLSGHGARVFAEDTEDPWRSPSTLQH